MNKFIESKVFALSDYITSYSAISRYKECKLNFLYTLLLPKDYSIEYNKTRIYSDFGKLYHYIMQDIGDKIIKKDNDFNITDIIDENIRRHNIKLLRSDYSKLSFATYSSYSYISELAIIDVEYDFKINNKIKGKIDVIAKDVVNDNIYIIDYKSTSYYLHDEDLKLQLYIYYYGLYYENSKIQYMIDNDNIRVYGIILAPLYKKDVEYLKVEIDKSVLIIVDHYIDKIKNFLSKFVERYKIFKEQNKDIIILDFILYHHRLFSGEGCNFCEYHALCPYGYSIDMIKELADTNKITHYDTEDIDNIIDLYKTVSNSINILQNFNKLIASKIKKYMITNNTLQYSNGKRLCNINYMKLVNSKVMLKDLYDYYGDMILDNVKINLSDISKKINIDTDKFVVYNVSKLYNQILVVR